MVATPLDLRKSSPCADEWVPAFCAQLSEATGWPLRFVPANHFSGNDSAPATAESCWQAQVRDGQQLVGRLRIDLPHEPQRDPLSATARQLPNVLADLVERVLTATRATEIQTHESPVLANLGRTVPKNSEMLSAVKQLLRAGLQLTGFRAAALFLLEPTRHELQLRVTHRLESRDLPQPTRSLRNEPPDLQVLSSGSRIVLRRGDLQFDHWLPADAAMGLCLPVQTDCGMLGTLWFYDPRLRSIDSREKHLLDSLSVQMASLLERVALQHDSTRHQRLRHELLSLSESEAETPIKTLRQPTFEAAWQVSSRFEIGGDLCEISELSDHEVAIVIGDATGNSVPAAVVMTSVHGALAALLTGHPDEARDTARVLARLNRALHHTRRLPHFMSLVYGVLDTRTMKLTYSNAGHPSPLLLRDGETISLESRGMLLGIIEEVEYPTETIDLRPQDLLIAFSDGVSEARGIDGQFFGVDGVLKSLGPNPQEVETLSLLHRVWSQQTSFAFPSHADDRSLLIARLLLE